MMSGPQLRGGVSFLDFLPQSTFINNSEFLNYPNGTTNTLFYPVLFAAGDGRNQSIGGSDLNTTFLKKKEINSFYFYKVSYYVFLMYINGN